MSLITESIPSLYNGISQQSSLVRSKDQLEDMQNGWASLADGLGKRPPTESVSKIFATAPSNALIHEINRDTVERYIVVAQSGSIQIYDLAGNQKTVNAPAGWGYLSTVSDYSADLAMFTMADYTFVVNRRQVCAMLTAGSDLAAQQAYLRNLNRLTGTDGLGVSFGPGSAYQYSPNVAGTFYGSVQSFSKLPSTNTDGRVYAVTGDSSTNFVSYYVQYQGGVYNECVKPGLVNAIDPTTMPWCLVREADGTFTFAPFSWKPRRVGDTLTNPNPAFIGRTIRKILFYQNRLALLTDENIVVSVAGDFGNFFRTTVLDALDSDPISVAANSTKVSILYDAVAYGGQGGLLLTSDQTQFSLTNGDIGLTSTSIAIRPVTNYEVAVRAGMVSMGPDVYYAVERNGYAAIKEYMVQSGQNATSASDVTAHVPRLIPSGVRKLVPAQDQNCLFVLTDGAPSRIYAYQFYWVTGTMKAQSCWHYWEFGAGNKVLSAAYLSGYLYVLLARADGVFLERINMQPGTVPSGFPFQVYLDRRVSLTGSWNPSTGFTTFTLPYSPVQPSYQLIRSSSDQVRPGTLINPASYTWTLFNGVWYIAVPGNETAGPVFGGEKYSFRIEFSRQYARKPDGTAVTTGRLQLRTWTLSFHRTAFIHTEVYPYGKDQMVVTGDIIPSKVKDYTGKYVGAADLQLNSPVLHTGTFSFQIQAESKVAVVVVSNDTHVPSTLLAAAWEGFYFNRAQA